MNPGLGQFIYTLVTSRFTTGCQLVDTSSLNKPKISRENQPMSDASGKIFSHVNFCGHV